MSKHPKKGIDAAIINKALRDSFVKLNPAYLIKNPVMFVVEIGFIIT
jgi:K+-transporting ATPase ATPase B chain